MRMVEVGKGLRVRIASVSWHGTRRVAVMMAGLVRKVLRVVPRFRDAGSSGLADVGPDPRLPRILRA